MFRKFLPLLRVRPSFISGVMVTKLYAVSRIFLGLGSSH